MVAPHGTTAWRGSLPLNIQSIFYSCPPHKSLHFHRNGDTPGSAKWPHTSIQVSSCRQYKPSPSYPVIDFSLR